MKKLIFTLAIGLSVAGCAQKFKNKPVCKNGVCTLDGNNRSGSSPKPKVEHIKNVIEVTAENFDTVVLQAQKPVVVDFYATWCGPCKAIKPIYAELAQEQPDWIFTALDVDKAPELAARCGVQAMPTFVVFKNGTQWGTIVGGRVKDQFMAEIHAIVAAIEPVAQMSPAQLNQTNELMQRIAEKNIDEIKKLIDEGVDVNATMNTAMGKFSPLLTAVTSGTQEIIDMLLKAGAATDGDFEASARKLLEMYADVAGNIRAGFEYAQELEQATGSVKKSAAKQEGSDVAQRIMSAMADPVELEKIIDTGVDVNEIFSSGGLEFTPLYMALVTNNRPSIEMLIKAGGTLKKEVIVEPNGLKKTTEVAITDMLAMHDQMLTKGYKNLAYVLSKN